MPVTGRFASALGTSPGTWAPVRPEKPTRTPTAAAARPAAVHSPAVLFIVALLDAPSYGLLPAKSQGLTSHCGARPQLFPMSPDGVGTLTVYRGSQKPRDERSRAPPPPGRAREC